MNAFNRRSFLRVLGAAAASSAVSLPVVRALAEAPKTPLRKDDAFIVIHAAGGWDVTLWADPRNAPDGIIDPATEDVVDVAGVKHWTPKAIAGGRSSFQIVERGTMRLGPAMGDLADRASKITIVNGISMETVSHPDGAYYSSTGRHLAGGRPLQTSIDTIFAGEVGPEDLLPLVSIQFPSTFLSSTLDVRATPLQMATVGSVGGSLARSNLFTTSEDRNGATMLLAEEAAGLAARSYEALPANRLRLQYEAVAKTLADASLLDVFDEQSLQSSLQPAFFLDGRGDRIVRRHHAKAAINAAFAVEAIKKGISRCVSFSASGFDTHTDNYADAPLAYQEFFEVISTLHAQLEAQNLAHRTHILVISEFCRTPQLNVRNGRDHYPNNSSLIISPTIKPGVQFGKSHPTQLLPENVITDAIGKRPVRPSDVLATMLSSIGIDPRKHLRDGEPIPELIA